jgi:hypothetical protein
LPLLRRVCHGCLAPLPVFTPARCPRCGRKTRRFLTPAFYLTTLGLTALAAGAWFWATRGGQP